jgi:hypothetical protein
VPCLKAQVHEGNVSYGSRSNLPLMMEGRGKRGEIVLKCL